MDYPETYAWAERDPEGFWAAAAGAVDWIRPSERVIDRSARPHPRWFPDGVLNTCFNAVDRHVLAGRGAQPALIHDSPLTGTQASFTYAELLDQVSRTAGMLRSQGVGKGDRVILYMPMVPEAVFAMLACARIGAVHSVVFGGFAAAELAKRIDDARPRLVVSASCGVEPGRIVPYKALLDRALELAAHKVERCVILQRPQLMAPLTPARDIGWAEAMASASPEGCTPVAATAPLYILYTSGTTGTPKGVVRDNGGHAVALAWSMANIYGVRAGDVFWAASDIGWVVGHSYIVYAPLLAGCTTVLYEGKPVGTPDAGAFWRVCAEHRIRLLFAAPTAIRAIRRADPEGALAADHDLSALRALFLAGERADPDTLAWAGRTLQRPVIDHWWQTELGWPALAACLGLGESAARPGSAGRPVPGFRFAALDEAGHEVETGRSGEIVIAAPLPPGCLPTLWNNDDGFERSYLSAHQGWYATGDSGFIDADGFVHVMGRIDDIINVAGHRLSTGGMEEVLTAHPDVAECAVIGARDPLKGQVPVGLLVLRNGVERSHTTVVEEVIARVRDQIGPVASFHAAAVVGQLPKTRSGKVLRGALRRIADGEPCAVPATIDDPAALEVARLALAGIGFPRPGGP